MFLHFGMNDIPPTTLPLNIAGQNVATGAIIFQLTGDANAFSGSAPPFFDPTSLNGFGGVSDRIGPSVNTAFLFVIDEIAIVPEPSTVALATIGLVAFTGFALRRSSGISKHAL